VYTTGYFIATVDFDPGVSIFTLTSAGANDIFVSKLDASGDFVWAIRMGAGGAEYANSITLDASFLYIMGDQYSATADYYPGAGTYNVANTGLEANFVGKYDHDGNFICAFSITPGHNETWFDRQLAVAGSNIYITGGFSTSAADFDPCLSVYNLPFSGSKDIYIAKYDMSSCDCSPLPITIHSFSGKNLGEYNLLEWVTASEINNDYFILERSFNGDIFSSIGQVEGAGNSNTINNYQYTDESITLSPSSLRINSARVYYRLKQVDYDGQYSYSKTISIEVEKGNKIVGDITPNPATNQITYTIDIPEDALITIQIVDILGKISLEENKEANQGRHSFTTDVSSLAKGMYFLKVSNQEVSAYQRFVK